MSLSAWTLAGIACTLLLIVGVSLYSGSKVKNAADFTSGGQKASTAVVAGAIMGTLVGGSSTIGTAQLAYNYGLSAWWFTLGGGIACLILALCYARPMRATGCPTVVGMLSREFGKNVGMVASVLSSLGIFINIISQLLAATAVIAIICPGLDIFASVALAAALMALYVIFGGFLGAGLVGIVKLVLLYVSVIAGGGIALAISGGFGPLTSTLDPVRYFNLFARGVSTDGGACLSLILGVVCTQSYAQALLAGKTDRAAQKGALISAAMIPPIGVGGIIIGLFMRVNHPDLASAKLAFPRFVTQYMPDFLGGVVLAALLIAVVGTGAGLSLGISSVVNNDIVKKLTHKLDDPKRNLIFTRVFIVIALAAACLLSTGALGDTILTFAFMSMGLRGAVIFVP
ncbi:MAG: sodium:solute symporter family protein, partial [Christensenellaceae bacterium]|nr:sodium:solute symporter family protein [Christensenellaceae bacterium]